jgi:hypothetical protein
MDEGKYIMYLFIEFEKKKYTSLIYFIFSLLLVAFLLIFLRIGGKLK